MERGVEGFLVYYHLDEEFLREQAAAKSGEAEAREGEWPAFPGDDVAERNHFIYQCHGTCIALHFHPVMPSVLETDFFFFSSSSSSSKEWLHTSTLRNAACSVSTAVASRTLSMFLFLCFENVQPDTTRHDTTRHDTTRDNVAIPQS
jgi:hypothetical protein